MIICKRPVPLDDHLQEAGPYEWSIARGRSLQMMICKSPEKKEKEEKEEKKEEKKFLLKSLD